MQSVLNARMEKQVRYQKKPDACQGEDSTDYLHSSPVSRSLLRPNRECSRTESDIIHVLHGRKSDHDELDGHTSHFLR